MVSTGNNTGGGVTKFRVRYRRARVTVEGPWEHYCKACGAHGRIELHHWKYAYTTKVVRQNPQLALENTIPFCYQCHKVADHIKNLVKDPERFHQVEAALAYAAIDRRTEELNVQ